MAIGERRNNAELMRDCAELGYLEGRVLDATYGLGRFWKLYRPDELATNDLHVPGADFAYDFTAFPGWWEDRFDTGVLDPPYKLNGTSTGAGPAASDVDYGVAAGYLPPPAKHELMRAGLTEVARVSRKWVLVKCQDQVCNGVVHWQTLMLAQHGERLGLRLVDQLHVRGHRAQPEGRRQVHARRDYSTLLVFRWPK